LLEGGRRSSRKGGREALREGVGSSREGQREGDGSKGQREGEGSLCEGQCEGLLREGGNEGALRDKEREDHLLCARGDAREGLLFWRSGLTGWLHLPLATRPPHTYLGLGVIDGNSIHAPQWSIAITLPHFKFYQSITHAGDNIMEGNGTSRPS
jgi:hypothetical protein